MSNPKELIAWSLMNDVKLKGLTTKYFKNSGRGLMTTKYVEPKEILISIPRNFLINFDDIFSISYFKNFFTNSTIATAKDIFLLFLILENRKIKHSKYRIYLESVPQTYTTPSNIIPRNSTVDGLPPFIKEEMMKQITKVEKHTKRIKKAIEKLKADHTDFSTFFDKSLDFNEVKWAWNVVNTRSVYFDPKHLNCSKKVTFSRLKGVDFALAPLLDMLNHDSEAQVDARFHIDSDSYEIQTFDTYKPKDQIFISYGCHDNRTLLFEYGFVLPNNTNANIPITRTMFLKYFPVNSENEEKNNIDSLLEPLGITLNKLCCTSLGFDWSFTMAAHISVNNVLRFPDRCKGSCVIHDKCDRLLKKMILEYDEYILSMEKIELSDALKQVLTLLQLERKILIDNLKRLDRICTISN